MLVLLLNLLVSEVASVFILSFIIVFGLLAKNFLDVLLDISHLCMLDQVKITIIRMSIDMLQLLWIEAISYLLVHHLLIMLEPIAMYL